MLKPAPPLTYHALLDHQRQSHGLSYQQLAERRLDHGQIRPPPVPR